MKEIKAYFRPVHVDSVVDALGQAGASDVTIIRVDAFGRLADTETDSHHFIRRYREKHSGAMKLELVCREEENARFVGVIQASAHTGEHGDGRVFVSDIDQAVSIRTGATGVEVL